MNIGPAGIEVPEGADPLMYVWGSLVPGIGRAASTFSQHVYSDSTLELEAFEAARLRVAQINGCVFCKSWRTERAGETVPEGYFDAVEQWETDDSLTPRARLAAEYAERFTSDHHNIDAAFWERMCSAFTAAEIVELSMCIGSWIAFGRLNRVLDLDTTCQLPAPRSAS